MLAVLLVGTAVAGLADVPREGARHGSSGSLVAGDLKLADDDQGPGDGVSGTFRADNMAPGDIEAAELELVREDELGRERAVEPKVTIDLRLDEATGDLADRLLVDELAYAGGDLRPRAEARCGVPLTLAALASCTSTVANPLANLSDPTPGGRSFAMGVVFDPAAGSALENVTVAFTVDAELHADARDLGTREPDTGTAQIQHERERDTPRACAGLVPGPVEPPAWVIRHETERLLDGAASGSGLTDLLLATQLPSSC